jgi:cytochrome c peroxidase
MVALGALAMALFASAATAEPTIESVGKALYFDTDLSNPRGQSCGSCHDPGAGFADPDADLPVSQGAVPVRFGNRNTPTAAYAMFIPERSYDETLQTYVGGQFWDGRAPTLEEQAKGPFLNPVEMNMPNKQAVVARVAQADYAADFKAVFGAQSLSMKDVEGAYDRIAEAIAAYERTEEVNPFTSKHDYAESLTGPARMQTYTMAERQGMMLFNGAAQCNVCHVTPMSGGGGMGPDGGGMGPGGGGGTGPGGGGGMGGGGMGPGAGPGPNMEDIIPTEPILFSDYRYANLGIPKNWESPFLRLPRLFNPEGLAYVDHGLAADLPGGVEANAEFDGMFRTPSLRNVGVTAPYGHNGYFKTLKEIVHFYNTRDVPGADWPEPEVPYNIDTATMGDLGLTPAQEDQVVAFLLTLTDGWWVKE